MAQQQITTMTCDRCGYQEEIRRPEHGYDWAALNYSQVNGHRWIGSNRSQKPAWVDLCPACSQELYDWYHQPKDQQHG